MPLITVQGTIIDFPDSGSSPNWAAAVIQFAQAVASGLSVNVGTYDIAPQNYVIDSYNAVSNQTIPQLQFPISQVRAAHIRYAVYRVTSTSVAYEAGTMIAVYDTKDSTWQLERGYVGDAQIAFNITAAGQLQFSTNATAGTTAGSLGGINHTGKISFAASTLTQN